MQPTLEVQGHPGIFAIGDIIEWKEQKQAGKASYHASVAVANLLSFLNGQPQLKKYKSMPEMIIIPVGKVIVERVLYIVKRLANSRTLQQYGAGYLDLLWGIVIGNWITKLLKGKGLLVSMSRSNLGH